MYFAEKHLIALKSSENIRQSVVGQKIRPYVSSVLKDLYTFDESIISDQEVCRSYLFELIENTNAPSVVCCAAVFGWGGMQRINARECLAVADEWLPIVDDVRLNKLSRVEAYRSFLLLREKKLLRGMGPAFFTKLIYFFGQSAKSRGYIMDQWTARSANLLLVKPIIHLVRHKNAGWVSDRNTEHVYEEFCLFIEKLSNELKVTTDLAEEMIFSVGDKGRKKSRGAWRAYVLEQG